jgi:putative tryptophan/tyrosine transport system substrate-binding protein
MKRREFITLLGGVAAAWPMVAQAQQPAVPVIGYLDYYSPEATATMRVAFHKGLAETGFVEGRNVKIEYRFAHNDNNRVAEMAAELVHRRVAVIATPFTSFGAQAAKSLSTTIPIVFMTGGDPVQSGLVVSFNRPGGNVTGLSTMSVELEAKQLGLLKELVPRAVRIALLVNPTTPLAEERARAAKAAASAIGWQIEILHASTNRDIEAAFASIVQMRTEVVMVGSDQFFIGRRVHFATLATHHRVPAIYAQREFVEVGALMSYGPSINVVPCCLEQLIGSHNVGMDNLRRR